MAIANAVRDAARLNVIEINSNGIPQMPNELQQYADLLMEPGSPEAKELADEIYGMWSDNGFHTVPVISDRDQDMPECRKLENARAFDAEYPDEDDYATEHAFEVAEANYGICTAQAKKSCGQCPLQIQCLANSVTQYARTRGETDWTRITYTETGIWGGWGPGAREYIFKEVLNKWHENPNDFAAEAFQDDDLVNA